MAVSTRHVALRFSTAAFLVVCAFAHAAVPSVTVRLETNHAVVDFTGQLQTASDVTGPYTNVAGASPHIWSVATDARRSWRARVLGVTTFATGSYSSMGIAVDGTLYGWGDNGDSQKLGVGSTEMSVLAPTPVLGTQGWASVSCGSLQQAGLKLDGSVWQWGHGLGIEPVRVGAETDWTAISCGTRHRLALKADGSLWAWGSNLHGELGNGTNAPGDHPSPQRVGTESDWVRVAAGHHCSLAIKTDGSLWAWGDNDGFNVTTAEYVSTNRPTRLGQDSDWLAVVCGDKTTTDRRRGFAAGLKTNGTLWAWGWNLAGQLGIGNQEHTNGPTRVGIDMDWLTVACGTFHTVAVKKDGTLWGWGQSDKLGITNVTIVTLPLQLGTDRDWIAIACGEGHTLAQRRDGSLWAWGRNEVGQLGTGSQVSTGTPTRVIFIGNWAQ